MHEDLNIRPVDELMVSGIVALDEKISGSYRSDIWETRVMYYIRRDPEGSFVAELGGEVVGFIFGEVRSGEFGLEEPTGWVEVIGVDPDCRGQAVGRKLAEAILGRFQEAGAQKVRTLVDREAGGLMQFFSSLGFEDSGLVSLGLDLAGTTS